MKRHLLPFTQHSKVVLISVFLHTSVWAEAPSQTDDVKYFSNFYFSLHDQQDAPTKVQTAPDQDVLSASFDTVAEFKAQTDDSQQQPFLTNYWATNMVVAQSASQQASDNASGDTPSAQNEEAQIAEAMLNPLSYLWLLFMQNDTVFYDGDTLDALGKDEIQQNITLLMPVFSQQLTESWKMIFRPVIPIVSYETLDNVDISTNNVSDPIGVDFKRESGLGDIVLWTAFSNQYAAPNIFGFGPTIMLDTASDEKLGTGKYAAGPMALAFKITDNWVFGAVAQHWWSFAGDDHMTIDTNLGRVEVERPDVNLTDIQPVIRYRYSDLTNIGMAPNWRYNHETDQLDLPIGMGFDTMIKIGPLPAKIGVEAYYFAEKSDDFGPDWQLRFLFVPVIAAPDRSRIPLFEN